MSKCTSTSLLVAAESRSETNDILEMGGASTQIAFEPKGRILADLFLLLLAGRRYHVYAHSYLPYGFDEGNFDRMTPPCCHDFPPGLTLPRCFRHSATAVWNSLPRTDLDSPSLTVFKSRLKTHLFHGFHLANTD